MTTAKRTPLQIMFDKLPGRESRAAKHIDLWQVHGETEYHASVEQHMAVGRTPEEAIRRATASHLDSARRSRAELRRPRRRSA